MAINIIHIANDEKFINAAIYQFEKVAPGRNRFYIIVKSGVHKTRHVRLGERVQILENSTVNKHHLITSIPPHSIVVFHSLSSRFHEISYSLPKSCQAVWFCFGYEVYNDLYFTTVEEALEEYTKEKFYKAKPTNTFQEFKDQLKPFARSLGFRISLTAIEKKRKAIARIDYLGSSFKEEFEAVCSKIGEEKKFFSFWYYPLERIVDLSKDYSIEKDSIWVGNSGAISGNHIDIFEKLKQATISKFKNVISPLSYGDNKYIEEIRTLGDSYFGTKYEPLLDFMPLQDYNAQLARAAIAIFYNKRQQALGNIITLVYMGCKVYLNPHNPIYAFMRRKGFFIYNFNEEFSEEIYLKALTIKEKKHNQKLLQELLKEDILLKNLKEQLVFLEKTGSNASL
tara:strand:+ start:24221 stop:25411 length:1191 start_codon:yes stop_codon:yes gene_type:complete